MRFFSLPVRDFIDVAAAIGSRGLRSWLVFVVALVATWFLYVPAHELLHAAGCLLGGGDVARLEIAPEYGAALLAQVFPFVVSGSRYAGQLTGFDVHGSDATYLATVLAPYVLTVFPGVPLLQYAARARTPGPAQPWLLGIALPAALAPIASLAGDYYEAGSIVVTHLAAGGAPELPLGRLRSDDLFDLAARLHAASAPLADWIVVAASCAAALVLALVTYHLGALAARPFLRRAHVDAFPENAR